MKWTLVDGDYVAFTTEDVFRLRFDKEIVKPKENWKNPITIVSYKLQARKIKNIDFRNLGYSFYWGDPDIEDQDSVDSIRWDDDDKIIERAEEILVALRLVDEEELNTRERDADQVPSSIPYIASRMIIKQLKRKQLLADLDETQASTIEDMIMRVVQIFRSYDFSDFINDKGKIDPIRVHEFELHIKMCMTEPSMYFVGGWKEIFDAQRDLHDEEWLKDSLEDEKQEDEHEVMGMQDGEHYWTQEESYSDDDSNPYASKQTKERVAVSGHVYLVRSHDLNLYGFRISKSDIHPDLHAQLNFYDQKYPLEVIHYFESDDVNRVIILVRNNFADKKVRVDYKKWGELFQYNWYELDNGDISKITDGTISDLMKRKLQAVEEKNGFLTPGGYVMLFRDKDNAYHLRTTTKANHRNLIWRGSHESIEPVIGFQTKDVENLREYFHNEFSDKRDFSSNREKYIFDEHDITKRIQSLPQNEDLQIVEVITSF
jgi:hypothetical protein